MKKVAMEWLGACSGCEIAFLNLGEELLTFLQKDIDIVHAPILMDHKYGDWSDSEDVFTLPDADIGFVSGGVANTEHLKVLEEMRQKCTTLIALGTCASHGGIPALMNGEQPTTRWQEVFETSSTDSGSTLPDIEVPEMLDRVYALDEKVDIDLVIAGCAPHPKMISAVLHALIDEREPNLFSRSVCDTCSVIREGKGSVSKVKRFTINADFKPDQPLEKMRCLLEQGFLCMGPVTVGGCGGDGEPACIRARVPCRGCYGPVKKESNQMLDMMNAITSNGIDFKTVVDRRSLLRFSGSHGRLRPVKKRK